MAPPPTIEQSKGNKRAHGTHDYPPHHTEIESEEWDVVIVGAGPAGLMSAASLARFGGHRVLVVDERSEPTTAGRADGIQPRTIEVLKNMEPLGSEFMSRSAASYERTFWGPLASGERGIERKRRVQSFPSQFEIEDGCTLGLQQGIIEGGFLRDMERHGLRVTRPWRFREFKMTADAAFPVSVTLERMRELVDTTNEGGAPQTHIEPTGELKRIKTKFLIGCDGGRSRVRKQMETDHGVTFDGDWVDTLWAALDCVVETDFEDVRKIAAIHSKKHGALYVFPREETENGEPIIRAYTQVNMLSGKKSTESALDAKEKVTSEMVQRAINEIAHPYTFTFKSVEWFTCYPIGQRLVSRYSLPAGTHAGVAFPAHHVFLAGDACHTHSPKAGQGMNTALIDAQALSWRINLVQKGLAKHDLLETYHTERHATGKKLIEFDSEYSALFSGELPKNKPELAKLSETELAAYFVQVQRLNAGFTTGVGVIYANNLLNHRSPSTSLGLATAPSHALEAGARLTPAWATRYVSSTPVRLIHEVQFTAPGGFRLYVLAGDLTANATKLQQLARHLDSEASFLRRFRANGKAGGLKAGAYNKKPPVLNSGLKGGFASETNEFFHLLLVIRTSRFRLELPNVAHLGPLRAMLYADDVEPGGARLSDADGDASVGGVHRKWGLQNGGVVVVRPDGYVGVVVGLEDTMALERYFAGFLQSSKEGTARL